ncbi:ketopantoate reductase family protein [Pseudonocardia dioxanivorans]|uniref:ketopantoate reductase family protein n=1 Tax=Pseudonocardia dioxanivorans TaxID=240495 RepID=UPI000CD30396|nr:2-dehydropantoate 2-reductase N-terminal domain-containing protein [Pseudonocardia dioxanivorans]
MKLLMFGRGTIATFYGWALTRAGHEVEFYVRPGRVADYGSAIDVDIRDDRRPRGKRAVRERWSVTMREDLPNSDHDYDAIVVSVNQDQLPAVVAALAPHVGDVSVLMFSNVWDEPTEVVAALPAEQIVWGFPGAAGGFFGSSLRGGILESMYLGQIDGTSDPERYATIRDLFVRAGFRVKEPADFRRWLWFHYIMDAALITGIVTAGGYDALVGDASALRDSFVLLKEMIGVLEARGGISPTRAALIRRAPAGPAARLLQPMLRGKTYGDLMRLVMKSAHGSAESSRLYARDVLATARRLQLPVPRLAAAEGVFAAGA